MKKILVLFILVFTFQAAYAETIFAENHRENCGCQKQTKCLDLMTSMYSNRATLYNVLNLSDDQQKCKDTIDKKRYEELSVQFQKYEQEKFVLANMCKNKASNRALKQQEKVVKDIENCMKKINKKYDKEFKSVLNSQQKSKLNTIRKMERKEIKYCQKNKAFYKKDPNLRPFGMYKTKEEEVLCPVHKKWHLFGYKHKN